MRVHDNDAFQYRVNYAAKVISQGGNTTRAFDSCFEMYDGEEVATILYRRSLKNPRLRENIWKRLCEKTVMESVAKLSHISTRDMPKQAAETRSRRALAAAAWQAERDAERDEKRAAA